MKFFKWSKDGGPDSTVSGLFVAEIKPLFSIVLLKFSPGSRDAYHTHAFNSLSWVLKGHLKEDNLNGGWTDYIGSVKPIWTPKKMFHKVISIGDTWVFSIRGPWMGSWQEYLPVTNTYLKLSNG